MGLASLTAVLLIISLKLTYNSTDAVNICPSRSIDITSTGTIESPGYPQAYDGDYLCVLNVTLPPQSTTDFSTGKTFDLPQIQTNTCGSGNYLYVLWKNVDSNLTYRPLCAFGEEKSIIRFHNGHNPDVIVFEFRSTRNVLNHKFQLTYTVYPRTTTQPTTTTTPFSTTYSISSSTPTPTPDSKFGIPVGWLSLTTNPSASDYQTIEDTTLIALISCGVAVVLVGGATITVFIVKRKLQRLTGDVEALTSALNQANSAQANSHAKTGQKRQAMELKAPIPGIPRPIPIRTPYPIPIQTPYLLPGQIKSREETPEAKYYGSQDIEESYQSITPEVKYYGSPETEESYEEPREIYYSSAPYEQRKNSDVLYSNQNTGQKFAEPIIYVNDEEDIYESVVFP
ncbi:uncharacterized protein [Watersipora subatra]|uniref:uncharacterized protein n=1 Tax=Watersipora subatra TaxID=2589382 RepID=UPI00355C71BF